MRKIEPNIFDAPVPGQSLTDTPKNYVWENPARFASVEDASLFIYKELNKKDILKRVIVLLEAGLSVEAVTRVIVFGGFIEGAFSVDTSLLLTPLVQKMVFAIGKAAGIENLKLTRPRKKESMEFIKQLYESRGYQPTKKDMKKAEAMIEDMPKGIMTKPEESK